MIERENKMSKPDTIFISFEPPHDDDVAIMVISRINHGESIDIINILEDEEAIELYQKLVTEKENKC